MVINVQGGSNDNGVMDWKGVEGIKIYRELMKSGCREEGEVAPGITVLYLMIFHLSSLHFAELEFTRSFCKSIFFRNARLP